jgi:hypothetical protein
VCTSTSADMAATAAAPGATTGLRAVLKVRCVINMLICELVGSQLREGTVCRAILQMPCLVASLME